MKVISWDIGKKNLAYCILELVKNDDTEDNKIDDIIKNKIKDNDYFLLDGDYYILHKWGLISFNDIDYKNEICYHNVKLKCQYNCRFNATHICWNNNNQFLDNNTNNDNNNSCYYVCKTHLKKMDMFNSKDIYKKNIQNIYRCDVDDCNTKAVFADRRNKYYNYCRKHMNSLFNKDESKLLKIVSNSSKGVNNTIMARNLYEILDTMPELLNVNMVLLENQPALKNPVMKSVQTFLHAYYVLRGYMLNKTGFIDCYSANNKLHTEYLINDNNFFKKLKQDMTPITKTYNRNKYKSIRLCQYFLDNYFHLKNNSNDTETIFTKNKSKQDDLADALLMTLHYLNSKKIEKLKKIKKKKNINVDNENN